jgi:hypothetical protein
MIGAILGGCLLAAVAGAQTNAPVGQLATAGDRQYAAQAVALEQAGANFAGIFSNLCQRVLTESARVPQRRVDDEVRAMFGGLWHWARRGGRPTLQGQQDKALHFIGGGAFQGYFDAGRAAAVIKEELDRRDPGNRFDLDDMAATMLGARWVDLATGDDQTQNRWWVLQWATGQRTLEKSLPELNFGRLQKGQESAPEEIKAVQEAVAKALPALRSQ